MLISAENNNDCTILMAFRLFFHRKESNREKDKTYLIKEYGFG